jgi:Flp pilus assembly protein TadG/uncharacterized protein YegL
MIIRRMTDLFRSFMKKEDGNFAMLAATLIPLTFAAGSFAVDFASIISMKTRLQNAADGAALATSSQLANKDITQNEAKAYAENFFAGMVSEDKTAFDRFTAVPSATITAIPNGLSTIWKVEVKTSGTQTLTPLAKFVGHNDVTVNVSSVSQSSAETSSPLSMVLVLDKSGSMGESATNASTPWYCAYSYYSNRPECYVETKLDALKSAVGSMVGNFKKVDPSSLYVRLGAVAYNDKVQTSDKFSITWDKDSVTAFTVGLSDGGNTNSAPAIAWAYDSLQKPKEANEHLSRSKNNKPEKYIVLMTDGANNQSNADSNTRSTCDQAKKDGMTIFSVAFKAPDNGQKLLKYCASSADNYFDAQDSSELLKAFQNIAEKAGEALNRLTM